MRLACFLRASLMAVANPQVAKPPGRLPHDDGAQTFTPCALRSEGVLAANCELRNLIMQVYILMPLLLMHEVIRKPSIKFFLPNFLQYEILSSSPFHFPVPGSRSNPWRRRCERTHPLPIYRRHMG